MFVSLDKGNEGEVVVLAKFAECRTFLKYRNERDVNGKFGLVLSDFELKTLFKRAIKKGVISKEDL